jgi:transcriptional regulator with XRE-family HTH domain
VPDRDYGLLMRHWRRRRGLSQLDLAVTGVSQRRASFLEAGRARPRWQMVLHLSELLDQPLHERSRLKENRADLTAINVVAAAAS